eukprot:1113825-Rhodomonas_salina.1
MPRPNLSQKTLSNLNHTFTGTVTVTLSVSLAVSVSRARNFCQSGIRDCKGLPGYSSQFRGDEKFHRG